MRRFSFVLPLALCFACAESAPSLDTGLPRETPANEVSGADAQAACLRYEELANDALGADVQQEVGCAIAGVVVELSGGGTCESSVTTCLASVPTEVAPVDFNCEAAVTFAPSGCTATIGELEDCVTSVARSIDAVTSQLDCSLADHLDRLTGIATDLQAIVNPATNEACAGLSEQCLDLLGWTAEAAPTLPAMP